MTDARISISLIVGMLVVGFGFVFTLQPYSVRSPWSVYDAPGQRFLSAALRQDSAQIERLSASSRPVEWAIHTAREHPNDLTTWAHYGHAGSGVIRADTAMVLFETSTRVCPLLITFVGHEPDSRVLEAESRC